MILSRTISKTEQYKWLKSTKLKIDGDEQNDTPKGYPHKGQLLRSHLPMDASLFATFNCWSFLANQLVQHEDLLSRQTHRNCATSWFGTMPMWWHCKELRRQQISWENCLNATNAKWTQPLDTCASNRNQNIAHPLATQQPSLTDRARTHEQHQDFLVNTNDAPRLSRSFIHSKLEP